MYFLYFTCIVYIVVVFLSIHGIEDALIGYQDKHIGIKVISGKLFQFMNQPQSTVGIYCLQVGFQ